MKRSLLWAGLILAAGAGGLYTAIRLAVRPARVSGGGVTVHERTFGTEGSPLSVPGAERLLLEPLERVRVLVFREPEAAQAGAVPPRAVLQGGRALPRGPRRAALEGGVVLVAEIRPRAGSPAERRRLLEELFHLPGRTSEPLVPPIPEPTHLRIQAAAAEVSFASDREEVVFYGSPPAGVVLTLFAGRRPLLRAEAPRLRCHQPTPERFVVNCREGITLADPSAHRVLQGRGLRLLIRRRPAVWTATLAEEVRYREEHENPWLRRTLRAGGPALARWERLPEGGERGTLGLRGGVVAREERRAPARTVTLRAREAMLLFRDRRLRGAQAWGKVQGSWTQGGARVEVAAPSAWVRLGKEGPRSFGAGPLLPLQIGPLPVWTWQAVPTWKAALPVEKVGAAELQGAVAGFLRGERLPKGGFRVEALGPLEASYEKKPARPEGPLDWRLAPAGLTCGAGATWLYSGPAGPSRFRASKAVRLDCLYGRLGGDTLAVTVSPSRRTRTLELRGHAWFERRVPSRAGALPARLLDRLALLRPSTPPREPGAGVLRVTGDRARLRTQDTPQGPQTDLSFAGRVLATATEPGAEPFSLACRRLKAWRIPRIGTRPELGLEALVEVRIRGGHGLAATGDRLLLDPKGLHLAGYPARLQALGRNKERFTVEAASIALGNDQRLLVARTGVWARLELERPFPLRLPAGSGAGLQIGCATAQADAGQFHFGAERQLRALSLSGAVRLRATDPYGRLVLWADAEDLHYARRQGAHEITLAGSTGDEVLLGAPRRQGPGERYRLSVPWLRVTVSNGQRLRAVGRGPGHFCFRAREGLFGRPGTGRVVFTFPRGFLLAPTDDAHRVTFPKGGRAVFQRPGAPTEFVAAERELAVEIARLPRAPEEGPLFVLRRGYAAGRVRFRLADGTEGGGEELLWEEATGTLTLRGQPARLRRPGVGVHAAEALAYNRATRRAVVYRGAGTLKALFDRRQEP